MSLEAPQEIDTEQNSISRYALASGSHKPQSLDRLSSLNEKIPEL